MAHCHVCGHTEDLVFAYRYTPVEYCCGARASKWVCRDQTACVARLDQQYDARRAALGVA